MNVIHISASEYREILDVLEHRRSFCFGFGGLNVLVAASIFAVSKFELQLPDIMIYVLLRIFVVTAVFGIFLLAAGIWNSVIMAMFERGNAETVKCNRPKNCANYHRWELKGKVFVLLKCYGFRYALRVRG